LYLASFLTFTSLIKYMVKEPGRIFSTNFHIHSQFLPFSLFLIHKFTYANTIVYTYTQTRTHNIRTNSRCIPQLKYAKWVMDGIWQLTTAECIFNNTFHPHCNLPRIHHFVNINTIHMHLQIRRQPIFSKNHIHKG